MKILALADVESKALWDFLDKDYIRTIDLILAAGDLKPDYLEYLTTFASADILYVRGNHDRTHGKRSPQGCICLEDTIYNFHGIRILGLGGSIRYKPGPDQYTEQEMENRIKKLHRQLKKNKGFDILLTHSPGKGLGDSDDITHTGFSCFTKLLDDYRPKYMIHGHVHMNYGVNVERVRTYGETTIINAYEKYVFEYETV
ncbi:MAG: metallophosphoesterase family protein [bacterium]|nr:metallophosphoesterase family protein [bacterium]